MSVAVNDKVLDSIVANFQMYTNQSQPVAAFAEFEKELKEKMESKGLTNLDGSKESKEIAGWIQSEMPKYGGSVQEEYPTEAIIQWDDAAYEAVEEAEDSKEPEKTPETKPTAPETKKPSSESTAPETKEAEPEGEASDAKEPDSEGTTPATPAQKPTPQQIPEAPKGAAAPKEPTSEGEGADTENDIWGTASKPTQGQGALGRMLGLEAKGNYSSTKDAEITVDEPGQTELPDEADLSADDEDTKVSRADQGFIDTMKKVEKTSEWKGGDLPDKGTRENVEGLKVWVRDKETGKPVEGTPITFEEGNFDTDNLKSLIKGNDNVEIYGAEIFTKGGGKVWASAANMPKEDFSRFLEYGNQGVKWLDFSRELTPDNHQILDALSVDYARGTPKIIKDVEGKKIDLDNMSNLVTFKDNDGIKYFAWQEKDGKIYSVTSDKLEKKMQAELGMFADEKKVKSKLTKEYDADKQKVTEINSVTDLGGGRYAFNDAEGKRYWVDVDNLTGDSVKQERLKFALTLKDENGEPISLQDENDRTLGLDISTKRTWKNDYLHTAGDWAVDPTSVKLYSSEIDGEKREFYLVKGYTSDETGTRKFQSYLIEKNPAEGKDHFYDSGHLLESYLELKPDNWDKMSEKDRKETTFGRLVEATKGEDQLLYRSIGDNDHKYGSMHKDAFQDEGEIELLHGSYEDGDAIWKVTVKGNTFIVSQEIAPSNIESMKVRIGDEDVEVGGDISPEDSWKTLTKYLSENDNPNTMGHHVSVLTKSDKLMDIIVEDGKVSDKMLNKIGDAKMDSDIWGDVPEDQRQRIQDSVRILLGSKRFKISKPEEKSAGDAFEEKFGANKDIDLEEFKKAGKS